MDPTTPTLPLSPPSPPSTPAAGPNVAEYRAAMRLSPDGQYWWDGAAWQSSDHAVPPMVTRTPDGYHWWDGARWRPARMVAGGTNGFAIASLVLGILWIFWVGSVLAVIFGHISLGQIHKTGESGRGMAIAGLVLGYVGIAIFLAALIGAAVSHNSSITFGSGPYFGR
jgi:hypothetical protein